MTVTSVTSVILTLFGFLKRNNLKSKTTWPETQFYPRLAALADKLTWTLRRPQAGGGFFASKLLFGEGHGQNMGQKSVSLFDFRAEQVL